jgi:phosphatidylglycerol---prolipoprotein diacylglyceryl transferase
VWTSIIVFLLATAYFVVVGRIRKGREETVWREGHEPPDEHAAVEEQSSKPAQEQAQEKAPEKAPEEAQEQAKDR